MNFIHVEGTQEEKPLEFDATTSKTVVYIRKNIKRVTKEKSGVPYEIWSYDEAQIPYKDFAAVASVLVSESMQNIKEITPYKVTKTAYIDDTEITFDNVPTGNLTVFFDGDYEVERQADRVVIHFEALEEVKEITIMVQ